MTGMSSREQDLLARATDAESDLRHMREYVSSLHAEVLAAIGEPLRYLQWKEAVANGKFSDGAVSYDRTMGQISADIGRLAALKARISSAPSEANSNQGEP